MTLNELGNYVKNEGCELEITNSFGPVPEFTLSGLILPPSALSISQRNYKHPAYALPPIKNVIFNEPATIVYFEDGTKTVVKCQDGDTFDPEVGLAMAIAKRAYGNKGSYCNQIIKWVDEYWEKYWGEHAFPGEVKTTLADIVRSFTLPLVGVDLAQESEREKLLEIIDRRIEDIKKSDATYDRSKSRMTEGIYTSDDVDHVAAWEAIAELMDLKEELTEI